MSRQLCLLRVFRSKNSKAFSQLMRRFRGGRTAKFFEV
jgi:hypothetical protein